MSEEQRRLERAVAEMFGEMGIKKLVWVNEDGTVAHSLDTITPPAPSQPMTLDGVEYRVGDVVRVMCGTTNEGIIRITWYEVRPDSGDYNITGEVVLDDRTPLPQYRKYWKPTQPGTPTSFRTGKQYDPWRRKFQKVQK